MEVRKAALRLLIASIVVSGLFAIGATSVAARPGPIVCEACDARFRIELED